MPEMSIQNVKYDKWGKVTHICQLLVAGIVFLVEVVNNYILYATRSQGYGPDTIVEKLLRYLVLTTVINFGLIIACQLIVKSGNKHGMSGKTKRLILMVATILICTDVSFSHYQFADVFAIFTVPLLISVLYEDKNFSFHTMLMCVAGQMLGVVARAKDPLYNKDIGPEAAIAFALTIAVYFFLQIIINTLVERRENLSKALIQAEQTTAAQERVKLSLKMLETLAKALDAKDKYTNGHSARVATYSIQIARALGWDEEAINNLKYEALLHDIGKIGVPDSILNKPDKLTNIEFDLIKSHTIIGADILKNMTSISEATNVAKYHHERYDGKGYPKNLVGEEIPLNARIVCIADAYDAMSSDRIYRKALPREVIREELVKGRGTQFDPNLLDIFLGLFDEHKLSGSIDALHMSDESDVQAYVMEDIDSVLRNITRIDDRTSTARDFEKFYLYMRNIGLRYKRSIEVMSINLSPIGDSDAASDEGAAMAAERAIKKSIRAVDVYFRYSDMKHLIIFLDAGEDNIDVIAQRIFFEFRNTEYKNKYEITYELNENLQ